MVGLVDRQHPHRPGRRGLRLSRWRRPSRAVANDGVYVKPRLVRPGGHQGVQNTPQEHRILPVTVAREMRKMLVAAVDHGTGTKAQIPGYVVGGKTGRRRSPTATRRLLRHQLRGLVRRHGARRFTLNSWCLVSVDEPRRLHLRRRHRGAGGQAIMQFCLQHLEIEPVRRRRGPARHQRPAPQRAFGQAAPLPRGWSRGGRFDRIGGDEAC